jgi:hypothetical protein
MRYCLNDWGGQNLSGRPGQKFPHTRICAFFQQVLRHTTGNDGFSLGIEKDRIVTNR